MLHLGFDPKPATPITIRGPYGAIKTNVPTIQVGELMPQIAKHMDRCALIRSGLNSAKEDFDPCIVVPRDP
jgi:hypothetical protein